MQKSNKSKNCQVQEKKLSNVVECEEYPHQALDLNCQRPTISKNI